MDIEKSAGLRIGNYRWRICALLFFATTINYLDRQVLGILAPYLQDDLGWNEIDYGNIVAAFKTTGSYILIFSIFSVMYLVAWTILKIGIPKIKPIEL